MRILIIGPLPPPVGGTTVLFRQLVAELNTRTDVSLSVVNTSNNRDAFGTLLHVMFVTGQILNAIVRCDVVAFHASRRGAALFGPIVSLLNRALRKPWIFRGFGDFEWWHSNASGVQRMLLTSGALNADIVLFEMKSAVVYFAGKTPRDVRWYPNSRPVTPRKKRDADVKGGLRFVYIGHVKPSKGVRELISAAELIDGVKVDVYGPLLEGMDVSDFQGKNARYCKVLEPSEVARVLDQYDVLLFPTFYEGEGYPGIILEAYARGLPVITTRWRSIPEIVTDETGILVAPRNVPQLAAAMRHLVTSHEDFMRLRDGTEAISARYASSIWTAYFVDLAHELHERAFESRKVDSNTE